MLELRRFVHTLHISIWGKLLINQVIIYTINHQCEIDLLDINQFVKVQLGVSLPSYICIINCLSALIVVLLSKFHARQILAFRSAFYFLIQFQITLILQEDLLFLTRILQKIFKMRIPSKEQTASALAWLHPLQEITRFSIDSLKLN